MPSPSFCTHRTCGRGAKPGCMDYCPASLSMWWFRSCARSGGCFAGETTKKPTLPKTSIFAESILTNSTSRPVAPCTTPSVQCPSCSHVRTNLHHPAGPHAQRGQGPHPHRKANARRISTIRLTRPCSTAGIVAKPPRPVSACFSCYPRGISTNTCALNAEPPPAQKRRAPQETAASWPHRRPPPSRHIPVADKGPST